MENLLNKISSYHIINYLLPGIIFCQSLAYFYSIHLEIDNIVITFFIYYFCGMLLSRIGSLIIDPIMINFVKYADHNDYLLACEKDKTIDNLLETRNLYRTLIVVFILLALTEPYLFIANKCTLLQSPILFFSIFVIIFVISHIKQTKYIVSRVNIAKKMKNDIDKI